MRYSFISILHAISWILSILLYKVVRLARRYIVCDTFSIYHLLSLAFAKVKRKQSRIVGNYIFIGLINMHNWFNFNWFAKWKNVRQVFVTQRQRRSKRDKWRLQLFIWAKKGGQHTAVYAPYYFIFFILSVPLASNFKSGGNDKSNTTHTTIERETHMISAPTPTYLLPRHPRQWPWRVRL